MQKSSRSAMAPGAGRNIRMMGCLRRLLYDLLRNLWSNLLRNLCYNLRSDLKQLSFYVQILLDDLGML